MVKPNNTLPSPDSQTTSQQKLPKQTIITALNNWACSANGMLAKMALKMGLASAISLIIAQWLQWEYPFYAVIAAIIVMSSTHGSTLALGIQRLIGTVIGAIGGAIFSATLGNNPWSLGISVFLTIFLANYWKFNEAAKLAGYVSAIVILTHNQSPWLYAWGRFLETLLGIGVALLVNNFVFPASAGSELRRCLSQTLVSLEQFYGLVVDGALTANYERPKAEAIKATIISSLQKGRGLWKEVRQGQTRESPEKQVNEAWEFLIRRIWEHILTMEHTVIVRQQDTFWQMLSPELTQLAQETRSAMLVLAHTVKSHKSHLSLPEIEVALTNATNQFNHLQGIQMQDYPIDELLRFFTFFYTMEEVGRKLQRMADTLSNS
ncbi:FUSC family protein [Scytonema sp. PRP1]|uniref:FUSC family protein n=1 Tax=Scytonema sp. PRP1 TaxID=3120513 RepID=UPI002FD6AF23